MAKTKNIICHLIGTKKDGYTLKLKNKEDNFEFSESFTEDELKEIASAIIKKLK